MRSKGGFQSEVSPLLVDFVSGSSPSPYESSGEDRSREFDSFFRETLKVSSFMMPKGTEVVYTILETFAIWLNEL